MGGMWKEDVVLSRRFAGGVAVMVLVVERMLWSEARRSRVSCWTEGEAEMEMLPLLLEREKLGRGRLPFGKRRGEGFQARILATAALALLESPHEHQRQARLSALPLGPF